MNTAKNNHRIYLAPILGVTDSTYRSAFARSFEGIDIAIAPFIQTIQGGRCKNSSLTDVLPEKNSLMTVIPQILSNQPEDFIAVAGKLADMGYDRVNLNLGCPMPTATKKSLGAGFLSNPERLEVFLDSVLSKITSKLSIKMRLGLHDEREIEKLIPILNRFPLAEVIIHARTADQMYSGPVNHEVFSLCCESLNHEIVYNGDIQSVECFDQFSQRHKNVKSWMIGRGVLKNPFLPALIKGKSFERKTQFQVLKSFQQELFQGYSERLSGDTHLLMKLKANWEYLSEFFDDSYNLRKKIKKCKKMFKFTELINQLWDQHSE